MHKGKVTLAIGTFVGASVLCSTLSVTYPIAIWAVAFGVLTRRKLAADMAQYQIEYQWQHRERLMSSPREVRKYVG